MTEANAVEAAIIDAHRSEYESLYRRIYRALRTCEGNGHALRAEYLRYGPPLVWGPDKPASAGYRPAVLWKLTAAGTDYLATRVAGKSEHRACKSEHRAGKSERRARKPARGRQDARK